MRPLAGYAYAKRTKKSDETAANVLGTMTAGGL
jgi:hypothetical protein